ncbi:MAG: zinc-ribbon domain-containing protein [Candidatus Thorarchaeota archaeon]
MFCQECGSEIENTATVCPFCGKINSNSDVIQQKDLKIQELEQKVAKLEEFVTHKPKKATRSFNPMMFLFIFILPLAFLVLFFVFFIILVSM